MHIIYSIGAALIVALSVWVLIELWADKRYRRKYDMRPTVPERRGRMPPMD